MGAVARAAMAILGTWVALIVLLLLPLLLPESWWYYIYSPASVGLWMLSMLGAPVLTCIVLRRWIAGSPARRRLY